MSNQTAWIAWETHLEKFRRWVGASLVALVLRNLGPKSFQPIAMHHFPGVEGWRGLSEVVEAAQLVQASLVAFCE